MQERTKPFYSNKLFSYEFDRPEEVAQWYRIIKPRPLCCTSCGKPVHVTLHSYLLNEGRPSPLAWTSFHITHEDGSPLCGDADREDIIIGAHQRNDALKASIDRIGYGRY